VRTMAEADVSVRTTSAGLRAPPAGGRTDVATELSLPGDADRASEGTSLVATRRGRRDWWLRRALAGSDAVALTLSVSLVAVITTGHDPWAVLLWSLPLLPCWIGLLYAYGLYREDTRRVGHSTLDDVSGVFHALLIGGCGSWLYFQEVPSGKLVFLEILLFGLLAATLMLGQRALIRHLTPRLLGPERVLFVGSGPASGALLANMRGRRRPRLEPVGVAGPHVEGCVRPGLPRLGAADPASLETLIAELRIERVIACEPALGSEQITELLHCCRRLSVKVSIVPSTFETIGPSATIDNIGGITVLGVNPPVLSRTSSMLKRAMDLAGAVLGSLISLPLLALAAIAIKLDSRGPVLFRQARIGLEGRRFTLLKLRTMDADAEARRDELVAQSRDADWLHLDHDPRITRVGRFLRLTSMDELPQLWNVLRGEMSLVGPRPLIAEEDHNVEGWARGRLDLTPGITGLWQVLGRTTIPFEEMVKLDYLYVTNWSLWEDIRLILRTLPVLLTRRGAN
jgi:exopolysaccharide biosynthesis polyprenyl glycosylphosphotransferase